MQDFLLLWFISSSFVAIRLLKALQLNKILNANGIRIYISRHLFCCYEVCFTLLCNAISSPSNVFVTKKDDSSVCKWIECNATCSYHSVRCSIPFKWLKLSTLEGFEWLCFPSCILIKYVLWIFFFFNFYNSCIYIRK